jgi:CrcB protein
LQKYLFIALGGALGSIARYVVGVGVSDRLGIRFPYSTLLINISACAIIGFSLEILNRHTNFNPALRYLIPIGFVGAYSTFSTFEWEIFSNLRSGAFWIADAAEGFDAASRQGDEGLHLSQRGVEASFDGG